MSWSWRRMLGFADEPIAAPVVQKPRVITMDAVMALKAMKPAQVPIADVFKPYTPMKGVVPTGGSVMAMDALPAVVSDPFGGIAGPLQGAFHEGLYFMGFPYLAQLGQRVEYRHAYEIWAEHTTRKWIKLRGNDEKCKAISDELIRLDARGIFQRAAEVDNQFGRSQIFLDFDDFDDLAELATELIVNADKITKARPLKRLRVVEPVWTSPAPYNTNNPLAPDFYIPSAWYVYGKTIHASRLLTIVGRPVSDMLKPAYSFGGQSLTALMKPYVDNWLRSRQSGSDLLHSFSVMVLATNMEDLLAPGAMTDMQMRASYFSQARDNLGLMVVNKADEELTNVSAPISGVEGLVGQALEQVAASARIPLSIYLQITPTGLNGSADPEIRSFYADVHAYQEDNQRPPLTRIIEIVQLSLFGAVDSDIGFDFEPLWEMSDKDKADIILKEAQADQIYLQEAVVDNEETRDRLRNDETSLYHGVNLTAPAPEIEENDDGDDTADQSKRRDGKTDA